MIGGNPNTSHTHLRPRDPSNMPAVRDPRNPFKMGSQQIAGKLAPQPNVSGVGIRLNSLPMAGMGVQRMPQPRPVRIVNYGY